MHSKPPPKKRRKRGQAKEEPIKPVNLEVSPETLDRRSKNPSLVCEICGKFLVGYGSLKKHMMSHLGVYFQF